MLRSSMLHLAGEVGGCRPIGRSVRECSARVRAAFVPRRSPACTCANPGSC